MSRKNVRNYTEQNVKITRRGLNPGGKTTDRNSPVGLIEWLGELANIIALTNVSPQTILKN